MLHLRVVERVAHCGHSGTGISTKQNNPRNIACRFFQIVTTTGPAMNESSKPTLTPDAQAMLDCLRLAVSKTLERKRRLGQYTVQWNGNTPFAVGDDAPESLQTPPQPKQ